jgi:hypothetical protein
MEVLLLAVMGAVIAASNIICFLIGAKVGQAVSKGETVEMPTINPFEAYKEREAKKEADKEQERFDTIMRNIENYDGTPNGQEEVR